MLVIIILTIGRNDGAEGFVVEFADGDKQVCAPRNLLAIPNDLPTLKTGNWFCDLHRLAFILPL
jgi:hypothetical protein